MSDLARVLRCSIQRINTLDAVRTQLWYAEVILTNRSEATAELQLEQRLALTWRFVVLDEQGRVLSQMSFVDGNSHFPKITRHVSIPPHGDLRTILPLLRAITHDTSAPGRYWVKAVFPVGDEQVESDPVEIVID